MWIWGLKGLIEEKKRRLYLNCIDQAFKVAAAHSGLVSLVLALVKLVFQVQASVY